MILAAGLGTRLRPLTDSRPKGLIEVGGRTLLERVASSLIDAGVTRLVINTHHQAEQLERFVRERNGFGVDTILSREEPFVLETGGALVHARAHFGGEQPILLHNVDIMTDADLSELCRVHTEGESADGRLATLAVNRRPTSRPLLVDDLGVFGRANRTERWEVVARHPAAGVQELGFAGIHVLSPHLLSRVTETGAFSIIDTYVRLLGAGERIGVHDISLARWADVGTPERLAEAREAFA